jgi:hypothetical protein
MAALKRTRADVESDLAATKAEKHRAQKRARVLKQQLAAFEQTAAEARALEVPWRAFVREAGASHSAWKRVTSRSELHRRKRECLSECDQRATALYRLRVLGLDGDGAADSYYICDGCFGDRHAELYELPNHKTATIDPADFEPERVAALRAAADADEDDDEDADADGGEEDDEDEEDEEDASAASE